MKIQIKNRIKCIEDLKRGCERHNLVISLNDNQTFADEIKSLSRLCKNMLCLVIDDVESDTIRHFKPNQITLPTKQHIEDVLRFVGSNERITIHCNAGVSRSSAMAFVIACAKFDSVENALEILDKNLHFPNSMIVSLGSEVLGKPEMNTVIKSFKESCL